MQVILEAVAHRSNSSIDLSLPSMIGRWKLHRQSILHVPRSLRRHRHRNAHPPPRELLIRCVAHHRTLAVFAEQSAPIRCHSQSPILFWCDPLAFFSVKICHLNLRVAVRSTDRDVIFAAMYTTRLLNNALLQLYIRLYFPCLNAVSFHIFIKYFKMGRRLKLRNKFLLLCSFFSVIPPASEVYVSTFRNTLHVHTVL
jgi:hypothetical protein